MATGIDPVKTLAKYLTSWLVAESSLGLSIGGLAKQRADEFFKLRDAFGVRGYSNESEAHEAIQSALLSSSSSLLTPVDTEVKHGTD